jgi:thiol-disulfide isomerase/thioredoxin
MITQADLDTLGLPKTEADRIKTKLTGAAAQFQKTTKELAALSPNTIWVHLETKQPHTVAADAIDAKSDLVRHRAATILYQDGEGMNAKHNWLQTGELVQVGKAWRIVEGPVSGMTAPIEKGAIADGSTGPVPIPPDGEKLIEELDKHDKTQGSVTTKAQIIAFNLKRAGILEQIAGKYKNAEDRAKRDVWLRQVADGLAAAAQQGDASAMTRITEWRTALAKDPASTALPYFAFREIAAKYANELPKATGQEALGKLQEAWKTNLTKFVTDFPKSEDAPDAMMQLGMVNEYFGPKSEEDAKAAYTSLIKNFPGHDLARRAQGCLDRLQLEGNALNLAAPTLDGAKQFNIANVTGKAVVVYYWASWNELAASDFGKIKLAMKDFAGKAELVGVNLDNKAAEASAFLRVNPIDGAQLFMPGGLESPLAVRYGITALPVMFLVGPDGKVVSRHVQASTLDDELKKLFKVEKDK